MSFPHMWPMNQHSKEVYITPFSPKYRLPIFVIYKGHTDPLQHIQRYVGRQPIMKTPLKAVVIIFERDGL